MIYFRIGTTVGVFEEIALVIGFLIAFLLGGWSDVYWALLMAQVLDVITGAMVGTKHRKLSSRRMKEGLYRKIGVWLLVVFAHMLDVVFFDKQPIVTTGISLSFIATEGLSLLENLGNLGVIVPDFIKKYLEQVRDNQDVREISTEKKEISNKKDLLL